MNKTIGTLVIALGLGLSASSLNSCRESTAYAQDGRTHFSNFGYVANVGEEITMMVTGDFNYDGKLDLAVGTKSGKIRIYENKMKTKYP